MVLSIYAKFIVRHYYLVLIIVTVISTTLTLIPLICHDLPSFSDPVLGFETRGTTLAQRFIAWENLIDETRPSRSLAVDPREIKDQIRMNQSYHNKTRQDNSTSGHRFKNKSHNTHKKNHHNKSVLNTTNIHEHWGFGYNKAFEDENDVILKDYIRKQWVLLRNMQRKPENPMNYASAICGPPLADYAHLVITNTDNTSMLTFENIERMCQLQSFLVKLGGKEYHKMCQRDPQSEKLCCPVWSVPNYIALISSKTSCEHLDKTDVDSALLILKKCAAYFHNFTIMASCDIEHCDVPKYCSQYNAVYNLLFYLIESQAFSPEDLMQTHVDTVMLFLPLARSSTVLPYYKKLQSTNLSLDTLVIPAMDFGLRNELFDVSVIQDTWLIGLGGIFVFVCVWFYSRSLILTLLLFTAIVYSLGIAYFMYVYVFNLEFFPFMNLLVIVVVLGIGADDAFLYCKVWKMVSKKLIKDNVPTEDNDLCDIKNVSSAGETILIQILEETMKHSLMTMLVTTLTTAVAFFASFVSYIPAISCFSVFAGTAVLVNFFLMITWLPVSVFIIDVKFRYNHKSILGFIQTIINDFWDDIRVVLNRFIVTCVTKLYVMFVVILGVLGICSIVVVFYYPGLQLPDSRQFQLFQTSHPFEQYDMVYRSKFLFERFGKDIGTSSKMPLRWVWGLKAIDNGNHMEPGSKGHLVFNKKFSISDPDSQIWLSGFCARLRVQPFLQQTYGPLLPNCFMESFRMYMSRRCIDKIDEIDRSPCCESSRFPYEKEVFDECIVKAIESLYQTSRQIFMPGVAGPKFLRSNNPPTVAAIVIEFESVVPYSMSYSAMDKFYVEVENWTQQELKNAPSGMKCGWFLSDLQFYDLQKTLASGTVLALILSATLGFVVLLPATFSFRISLCALLAMIFSATVTIAILVLNGWKLNILESVAISTSAGLAVDFSLHYALSYTNTNGAKSVRVKNALSASAGPTAAAALTTGFSGIFLLRSNILPYSQIGSFLALIMVVSWTYATFFLCSLLYIVGSNSLNESPLEEIKSVSHVTSVSSDVHHIESHELQHLADSNRINVTHPNSPSNTSATTVVLHDDDDNANYRIVKKCSITSNNIVSGND